MLTFIKMFIAQFFTVQYLAKHYSFVCVICRYKKNNRMKYIWLFAALCFSYMGHGQTISAYKAEDLIKRTSASADTVFVINFWATWCGPCVKELPEFNKLYENNKGRPVKFLMVSLDFKGDYQRKLPPFIQKKKMKQEVIWLNETNANEFIPKIEPQWQGSIPATLILYGKNEYRSFYEGTITAEKIQLQIDRQLAF